MRRVIGIDLHRTFGEVVIWENGALQHAGRVDMTRTGLEGFGKSLRATDEVVIEATGSCMAVSRVLSPFVKRVVIANPLHYPSSAAHDARTPGPDATSTTPAHAPIPEASPTNPPRSLLHLSAAVRPREPQITLKRNCSTSIRL